MTKKQQHEMTDQQIVSLVVGGNQDAYSVIVERYEAKLMRYALFLIKDYDMASDLAQESFIKAYTNLNGFKLDKSFSSWIYRIVHNEAMNMIFRNKKSPTFSEYEITDDDVSVNFSIDKKIDAKLLKQSVKKCLKSMDVKYREVVVLYYFENLKYDEISDILRVPTSTVGVRINRAKAELKKICQNDGVDYE